MKFLDWQRRVKKDPPLPPADNVSVTFAGYPVLNGQNF